ncbi:MAG: 1-acyl-sn-glycerol-3-phosphate acyltransferase [Bifidobacteriaceae bacterium]|jgi:1-acyl-sn-glycerol-3-phosphate acyltransferase|nr:1-acyl-sn-glycerol-3-phosphate acyltransferase [Bifidobacteriaceae bacterium]
MTESGEIKDEFKFTTYKYESALANTAVRAIRSFLRRTGEFKVINTHKLSVPKPLLIVANHITNYDSVALAIFLVDHGIPPHIFAKAELWKMPVVKQVLNATHMISVERNSANAANSLENAKERLSSDSDGCIFMFPEGTTTKRADKLPMDGKTGAARLLLNNDIHVLPIAIDGTQNKPRKVQIKVGNIFDFNSEKTAYNSAESDDAKREIVDAVTSKIMQELTVMVKSLRENAEMNDENNESEVK